MDGPPATPEEAPPERSSSDELNALKERCERAEAALDALRHRNRIFGDSAPFGILAVGLDGRMEGINRRMRELLLLPDGTDVGRINLFDLPALAEAGVSADFSRCMQNNQALVLDYACVDHQGSCLQLRFYMNPVCDGGNVVQGAIAFVENYTSVKLAQTAAAESEERYRLLFQSAPVAMVERDASELKTHLEQLRQSGIADLKKYFKANPEEVARCMSMIKTVDCNDAFLQLLEAGSKSSIMENLPRMAMGSGFPNMAEEIILTLADGHFPPERELTLQTMQGHPRRVISRVMVLAGHESTLSRIVISLIDISKRVEAEEALRTSEQRFREQSLRDNLTGLYNQRYLYKSLPQLLHAAKSYRTPVSLVFMDLDNFKKVVDSHGHLNGSRVIQEVAATIKAALVSPCYAVAYAGDEFVLVLPDFNEEQALRKAEEVKSQISGTSYLRIQAKAVQIQVSCGIATYPVHAEDAESLLAAADSALFQIKGTGKGAVGRYGGVGSIGLGRSFINYENEN